MTAHDQRGRQAHDHDGLLRKVGLAAALGLAALAALLWFVADAAATKECSDTGYGLGDSIRMTEEGCEVTVRATDGVRSAVLPITFVRRARFGFVAFGAGMTRCPCP